MRSRARARFVAALLPLASCHAYRPSSAPLAPNAEMVRIPFKRPQVVVIARDDPAAGWSDTLDNVRWIEGSVMELRGDTLRMDVDQLSRNGELQPIPAGRHAMIDMSTASRVERIGFSWQRTAFAATGVTVLVVVAAGVAFLVGLSLAYEY